MLGPILQGNLITLVPVEPEHIPYCVLWSRDPNAIRYFSITHPLTAAGEEEWYKEISKDTTEVVWTIIRNDKPIGTIGIESIDWRNLHGITGIWIEDIQEHRKGYGTEAIRLRTAYALEELGLEKLNTAVLAENSASIRALEHAGYVQCGLRRSQEFREGRWHDQWLGEILRDEWLALHRDTH